MLALAPALRRQLLEQARALRIPGPVVVLGQPVEAEQLARQRRGDVERQEARTLSVARGPHLERALGPPHDLHAARESLADALEGRAVGVLVVAHEVAPAGARSRLTAGREQLRRAGALRQERLELVRQPVLDLVVRDVDARQHADAVLRVEAALGGPATEAGVVRGDRRDAEREALLRRVAPGLVVGREAREVHRAQHRLVGQPDQIVVPEQVDRDLQHLHAGLARVVEPELRAQLVDRVVLLVEQVVRRDAERAVQLRDWLVRALQHLGPQAGVAGRREHEQDHAAALALLHGGQRLEQHVEALVVELVAAGGRDEGGVAHVLAEEPRRDVLELRADLFPRDLAGHLVDDVEVDAVGRDRLGPAQVQELRFLRRDLADRAEHVGLARAGALHRVLGLHAVGLSELLHGGAAQAVVRRHAERRERAAEHRRVGREHGAHGRRVLAQVQQRGAGHPLVRLDHRATAVRCEVLLPPLLDHAPGGVAEQHGLDVVPVALERVDAVVVPQVREDVVLLLVERGEVHQDRARRRGDLPAADAHADARLTTGLHEGFEGAVVLERRIVVLAEEPGTDADVVVAVALDQGLGLAGQHGVDPADLVADLPRDLEEGEGATQGCRAPGSFSSRSRTRCCRSSRTSMKTMNES